MSENRDVRVDAYIQRAPEYARPILDRLRQAVHSALPDVEEAIKWGAPTFEHHGIVCSMAAFMAHSALRFWKEPLMLKAAGGQVMALKKIGSVADLPVEDELIRLIRLAADLNEKRVKAPPSAAVKARSELEPPDYMLDALRTGAALEAFEALSPSHRREYVEWIAEAKREETRQRRLATAVEWIAEGKPRNWKYM
jgi:hypothetical protein